MKVQKIEQLWKDLEGSYEKIGEPKGLSRVDFFKSLISYKPDGSNSLGYLIKILNDDMQDPNIGEHLEACTMLITLFKGLITYLDTNGMPEYIDDLHAFLLSTCTVVDKFTLSDITNLYCRTDCDSIDYPYSKMISLFGCVESYSCFIKDRKKSRKISPVTYKGFELGSDKFKVLRKENHRTFLEQNYATTDLFIGDCARVLVILMQAEIPFGDIYVSAFENFVDGKLFGRDAIEKFSIPCKDYKLVCYKVDDFEVYTIC